MDLLRSLGKSDALLKQGGLREHFSASLGVFAQVLKHEMFDITATILYP